MSSKELERISRETLSHAAHNGEPDFKEFVAGALIALAGAMLDLSARLDRIERDLSQSK